jgi:glycosyltransferase 2 family protein
MTSQSHYSLVNKIRPRKIILPVLLGLAVIGWFISKEINTEVLSNLIFTWKSVFWLFIAWLCMVFRDLGYIIRIRILTDNDLSWRQAFRVIMLWEFTSSISPSTIGGTAVAIVFLNKEGISVGKSTAVVMATSFLDELYFVLMLPLLLLIVGKDALFTTSLQGSGMSFLNELSLIATIGYSIIFLWVLLVGYGLFLNPEGFSKLINKIFRFPPLKRWEESAKKAGNDIIESSHKLRGKPFLFWVKAMTATILSWTARYWVANAIIVAFFTINDHFLIFARQLATWVMMIISPSPGGAGFAELILGRYISDQIPADPLIAGGIALAIAIIWRIISYYPYLIIGALLVPGWIEKKFIKPITKKI